MIKINLRELFTISHKNLSNELLNNINVIYSITNLINGNRYIGQAKWFGDRFLWNSRWSHLNVYINYCKYKLNYSHLYSAIRKYKSRNFEVTILESDVDNLNEREKYWIKYYHTYFKDPEYKGGYNMTYGGEDCSHMIEASYKARLELWPDTNGMPPQCIEASRTKEANDKRVKSDKANHGGKMAMNSDDSIATRTITNKLNHNGILSILTEDAINKSHEVLTKIYGNPAGRLLDLEVREKALATKRANGNGDCMYMCRSDEAKKLSEQTQRNNHGGKWAFNTKSTYDTQRNNHNGKLPFHDGDGELNQRISRWFTSSNKFLSECDGTLESYWNRCTWSHVYLLRDYYDIMKTWDKWTEFHDKFYEFMINKIQPQRLLCRLK